MLLLPADALSGSEVVIISQIKSEPVAEVATQYLRDKCKETKKVGLGYLEIEVLGWDLRRLVGLCKAFGVII